MTFVEGSIVSIISAAYACNVAPDKSVRRTTVAPSERITRYRAQESAEQRSRIIGQRTAKMSSIPSQAKTRRETRLDATLSLCCCLVSSLSPPPMASLCLISGFGVAKNQITASCIGPRSNVGAFLEEIDTCADAGEHAAQQPATSETHVKRTSGNAPLKHT